MTTSEIMAIGKSTPITKETVRQYLCPNATDQELTLFVELCIQQGLNPFLKEAYLIKYGSSPASMVVAKDAFLKKANKIDAYKGFKAGVIVDDGSTVKNTEGLVRNGESIVGGWAVVYRENREPLEIQVNFSEYAAKKADGTLNGQWSKMPATMIRKVALVQAHREAFPDQFQGMYDESELPAMTNGIVIDAESSPQSPMPQPIQKGDDLEDVPLCVDCQTIITKPSVVNFSQKKFGETVCYDCQQERAPK